MGNRVCCVQRSRTTAAAKVIRWQDGSVEEFGEVIKVGELMLDNPQQFLCDFSDLQAGRRISALRADENLALGRVYVLLPMQKYLGCVLSFSDMASFNSLAFQNNYSERKLCGISRILPSVGTGYLHKFSGENGALETTDKLQGKVADQCVMPKVELDVDIEVQALGLGLRLREQKIRRFGYWKPVLETIDESPRVSDTETP